MAVQGATQSNQDVNRFGGETYSDFAEQRISPDIIEDIEGSPAALDFIHNVDRSIQKGIDDDQKSLHELAEMEIIDLDSEARTLAGEYVIEPDGVSVSELENAIHGIKRMVASGAIDLDEAQELLNHLRGESKSE